MRRGGPWFDASVLVSVLAAASAWGATTISSREDIRLAQNTSGSAVSRRCPPITITKTSGSTIDSTNDVRIKIPSTFDVTWDTSSTLEVIGTGADHIDTGTALSYEDSNRTVVISVSSSVTDNDSFTVYGLKFSIPNNGSTETADELELIIAGSGQAADSTDDKKMTVYETSIDSTSHLNVNHGGSAASPSSKALGRLTLTDVSGSGVDNTNDIRIRIPSTLGFTWDTSVTAPSLGGTATGKVASTVSYESSGTVLKIDATQAGGFSAGDTLTLDDLAYLPPFNAGSLPADVLELILAGSGGAVATVDRRVFARSDSTQMTATAQTVSGSASDATLNSLRIVAGDGIGTDTYTGDLRLIIPFENNLSFDGTQGGITVTTTSGAVSSTPTVEDSGEGNKVLRFDVTSAVSSGAVLTIAGILVDNASSSSEAVELFLGTNGPDQVDAVLGTPGSTSGVAGGAGGGGGGDFVTGEARARGALLLALGAGLALLLSRAVRSFRDSFRRPL